MHQKNADGTRENLSNCCHAHNVWEATCFSVPALWAMSTMPTAAIAVPTSSPAGEIVLKSHFHKISMNCAAMPALLCVVWLSEACVRVLEEKLHNIRRQLQDL